MPKPSRKRELEEGPIAGRRFSDTLRHILSVPKVELERREAAYKRARKKRRAKG